MPRNENSRGSIDRRSLFHTLDNLIPLRESRWPLVEVRRPISIRIVSTPILFDQSYEVPYVPTSEGTVKRMFEIADVGPEDVVYDLGCGDGRILIMAAEKFNAKKAVGYEIREDLYKAALQRIENQNLGKKITIVNGDLFDADISEATVITLYLTYEANKKLRLKLERDAKPSFRKPCGDNRRKCVSKRKLHQNNRQMEVKKLELSRERARKLALDQFKYVRTCVLARELCSLVRRERVALEKEDVRSCCELISKLCMEAGCEEPSGLCSKAAEAVMESEETYLKLCEESCKKCGESRRPRKPTPPRAVYVA